MHAPLSFPGLQSDADAKANSCTSGAWDLQAPDGACICLPDSASPRPGDDPDWDIEALLAAAHWALRLQRRAAAAWLAQARFAREQRQLCFQSWAQLAERRRQVRIRGCLLRESLYVPSTRRRTLTAWARQALIGLGLRMLNSKQTLSALSCAVATWRWAAGRCAKARRMACWDRLRSQQWVLSAWQACSAESTRARIDLQLRVQRKATHTVGRGLQAWICWWRERTQRRMQLRFTQERSREKLQRQSFSCWQRLARDNQRRRLHLYGFAAERRVLAIWQPWRDLVIHRRRQVHQTVERVKADTLWRHLWNWRQLCDERQKRLLSLQVLSMERLQSIVLDVFHFWQDDCKAVQQHRIEKEAFHQLSTHISDPDVLSGARVDMPMPAGLEDCACEILERTALGPQSILAPEAATHPISIRTEAADAACSTNCVSKALSMHLHEIPSPARSRRPSRDSHAAPSSFSRSVSDDGHFYSILRQSREKISGAWSAGAQDGEIILSTEAFGVTCVSLQLQDAPEQISEVKISSATAALNSFPTPGLAHKISAGIALGDNLKDHNFLATSTLQSLKEAVHLWRESVDELICTRSILQAWRRRICLSASWQLAWKTMVSSALTFALVTGWWADRHLQAVGESNSVKASGHRLSCARRMRALEVYSCVMEAWQCLLMSLAFNRRRQIKYAWLMLRKATSGCRDERELKFSICKSHSEAYLLHSVLAIWKRFSYACRELRQIQQRTALKQCRIAFDTFHLGGHVQRISRQSFQDAQGSCSLVWTVWCISIAHLQSSRLRNLLIAFRFWVSQLHSSLIRHMLLNNLRQSGKLRAWKGWALIHQSWREATRQGIRKSCQCMISALQAWHCHWQGRRREADATCRKFVQRHALSEWLLSVCQRRQALETLLKSISVVAFHQPWIQLRVFGARCYLSNSGRSKAISRVWSAWSQMWRREKVEQRVKALRSTWHAWSIAITALKLETSLLEQEVRRHSLHWQRYRAFNCWEAAVKELLVVREKARSKVTSATQSKRESQQFTEAAEEFSTMTKKATDTCPSHPAPKTKHAPRTSIWRTDSAVHQLLKFKSIHRLAISAEQESRLVSQDDRGCAAECRHQGRALGALQGNWRARYVHQRLQSVDHLAAAARIIGAIQRQCIHAALRQWNLALQVRKLTEFLELQQGTRAQYVCFGAWQQHCSNIAIAVATHRVASNRSSMRGALWLLQHSVHARCWLKDELVIVTTHLAFSKQQCQRGALLSWRRRTACQNLHRRTSSAAVGSVVRARQRGACRRWRKTCLCRRLCKCAVLRCRQRLQRNVLQCWSSFVVSQGACRCAAQAVARKAEYQLNMEVFGAWKDLWMYQRHCRSSAKAVFETITFKRRLGVLSTWKRLLISERSCRQAAHTVQQRCLSRMQHSTLLMWRSVVAYDRHCASAAQKIAHQVAHKQRHMVMNAWAFFWRDERLLAATSRIIVERVAMRCLSRAFKIWSSTFSYQRQCQHAVSVISQRADGSLLVEVLRLWSEILKAQNLCRKKGNVMHHQAILQQMCLVIVLWRSLVMSLRAQCNFGRSALQAWNELVLLRHRVTHAAEQLTACHARRRRHDALRWWSCSLSAYHARKRMTAQVEQYKRTLTDKCRHQAVQQWHRRCRVRSCHEASISSCVKLHITLRRRAALRDWRKALPSLLAHHCRVENINQVRISLQRHRRRDALTFWSCISRYTLTNRSVRERRTVSLLSQIFQCFQNFVRVRRAALQVRSRILGGHVAQWTTAARIFRKFRMLDAMAQVQIKRFSLMWFKDCWLAPLLLLAWKHEAAKALQLFQAERLVLLLKIDCLSKATRKWLQFVKRRRLEKKTRERVQSLRQRATLGSWWRYFTVNRRCPDVLSSSLLAICLKCWWGASQMRLAAREVAQATLHAWHNAVEEHRRYLRSMHRFYWCCKQSNVIAAKVAAREAVAVISVWHAHAVKSSMARRCYAQGMYRAHWRPAQIAFRGLRLWQAWQQTLPQVECLTQNMSTAVNVVLVGVFERWSSCSAALAMSRRSALGLLRNLWRAWQAILLWRKRMDTGARKLLSLPLSWGLQAVCQHMQVTLEAEERAIQTWQRKLQAASLQAWRAYLAALGVERASFAFSHWKKWIHCMVSQRWFAVWQQHVCERRRNRRLHVPSAMQWWHRLACNHAEERRRLGFADAFASRQHLRKVFVGWLLATLQGSCQNTRIMQPLPMVAMLPGGPSIDRLSLWAAAAQQHQHFYSQDVQSFRPERTCPRAATGKSCGKVPGRLEGVVARRQSRGEEKENQRPVSIAAH